MTDQDKISLVDSLLEKLAALNVSEDVPIMVGCLSVPFGINGFDRAQVGHYVFESRDRYIIYLTGGPEGAKVAVPFYKNTLRPNILFTSENPV